MNKEELLKSIEQKRQAIWPTDTGKMAPATVPNNLEQGWLNALKWMENLINSLPDEQPSENLEEYYTKDFLPKEWFAKQGQRTLSEFNFFTASHFAQWQKEKTINKAWQWLQHNAEKYVASYGLPNYQTGLLLHDFKHAMEDNQ